VPQAPSGRISRNVGHFYKIKQVGVGQHRNLRNLYDYPLGRGVCFQHATAFVRGGKMRAITAVTRRLKGTAAVVLMIGSLALAAPVEATPIPIGTTPADDLILNFNFPAMLAGAPYAPVMIVANFTGFTTGDALLVDVFKGLNGTGGVDFSAGPVTCGPCGNGMLQITITYNLGASADVLDGVFSVGFRLGSGAMDLSTIVATATNAAGASLTLPGTPVSVPEPGTMSLVLLALAVMARRRIYG
jgi:hypothetical protein